MKSSAKVIAVVVSYQNEVKLAKCLASLKKSKVETVVIANNQVNLGFARGANLGIKKALAGQASHVLLVNQDVVVPPDFLKPLLGNHADIVAPIIKFKRAGCWIKDYGGIVDLSWGTTAHQEDKFFKTPDFVSGCAMLIKKVVFRKVGLFDERFFLYFEDVDFCLRARQAGFKVGVEPTSWVIHELEEGRRKSRFKKYHHFKSHLLFINKYLPWWKRPLAWTKIILC